MIMDSSQIYIAISIAVLAVIALLLFFVNKEKKEKGLSKLAGIAFAFIIAGIIFGEDKMLGYGLTGIGVVLALTDIVLKSRRK
jgi:lipopolysaccharide export LptBFGC system permease protein LptF